MSNPCDQIGAFVDGELSAPEAEAFRDHLAECPHCQEQLAQLLLLERMGDRYMERRAEEADAPPDDAFSTPPFSRPLSRWPRFAWGVGAACVLVLALVLGLRREAPLKPPVAAAEVAWNPPGRTSTSPRVSEPRADQYRPISAQLMDGTRIPSPWPSKELGEMEARGDVAGQAAVFLAWNRPGEALPLLEGIRDPSPGVRSNQAAALLALGRPEEALRVLDPLLSAYPQHPQARWNRALVLEALQLPLLAARDFQTVSLLGEEGWAREAEQRASALMTRSINEDAIWKDTLSAGKELVSTGQLAEGSPLWESPLLRLYFYEVVRTRSSAAQVLALRPLAQTLDAQSGGRVLQQYVERISQRDFSKRAPWVREYVQLLPSFKSDPRTPAFLDRLLTAGEPDLLLGALLNAGAVREHLEAFSAGARVLQDPWFELLAIQTRASVLLDKGDLWTAQSELERARALCDRARIAYRCGELELDFAHLYAQFIQPDAVHEHASRGLKQAREERLRTRQFQFLEMLAKAARLRDDVIIARTYLNEALEHVRGKSPAQEQYIHQELAHLAIHALDFERARAEIDAASATGSPLTLYGAAALSDIARQRPKAGDEQTMNDAVTAAGAISPGRRALAHHYLGRFLIEKDRQQGQTRLREVIREADAVRPDDEDALHARTYSYTSLILDHAKAREFEEALRLFGEELRGPIPDRCMLALTVDSERAFVAARGPDGVTQGAYDGARTRRVNRDSPELVPASVLALLKDCTHVRVLARPPLQGLAQLLPSPFAWSYQTQLVERHPSGNTPVHLVVEGVEYAPERRLPALAWTAVFSEGERALLLRGDEATPDRVLRAMEEATEIDLVTHGLLSPVSDASFLVLAKERGPEGSDELTVRRLRQARLRGSPLVVIAACHGGHTAPVLHEPVSLPHALISAGARAVLAATIRIPDQEASDFFNAIRARIRQGASTSEALRDERLAWHQRYPSAAWVDSVLLFE